MKSPGVPEDLDHIERVWARALLLALATKALGDGDAYTYEGTAGGAVRALRGENAGGSYWWRLQRWEDGRAVLCGQDADGSDTHLVEPPVDLLAGGPDWLPWERLRFESEGFELGYVYWWQDEVWARAPYSGEVEDDGLGMSVPWAGTDGQKALVELRAKLESVTEPARIPQAELDRLLGHIQARTVDETAVREVFRELAPSRIGERIDVAAALTLADTLGVMRPD